MITYVLGFAFDPDLRIALIKKDRPADMAGLWNGIGGKVETGEAPIDAMVREFTEECGVITTPEHWQHYATLRDTRSGYQILCFVTVITPESLDCVRTMESEEVKVFTREQLAEKTAVEVMPNLSWLMPMALSLADRDIPVMIDCGSREVLAHNPLFLAA
jgi:8-oxo-dGTP diphosphatase